tara:strand:- start:240 stop:401 length:162 start_codon:yes stop_codon:yes gene_type:complete
MPLPVSGKDTTTAFKLSYNLCLIMETVSIVTKGLTYKVPGISPAPTMITASRL